MKARTTVFNGIIELNGTIPLILTRDGTTIVDNKPTDSGLEFVQVDPTEPIYPINDPSLELPEFVSLNYGISGEAGVSGNIHFAYLPVNLVPMYNQYPYSDSEGPSVFPNFFLLLEDGSHLLTEDASDFLLE